MQQTIINQRYIVPLDYRLNPNYISDAPYQLEIYHTKEQPKTNIGVINYNTGLYSYHIGDVVDVTRKITVSNTKFLTNVVVNPFLQNYLQTR